MTRINTNLILAVFLSLLSALAAEPPKPAPNKPLPDAAKVKILSANATYMNLKSYQQALRLQANDMEKQINDALGTLNKEINEARAAAGCASVTPDLDCVPPPEPAKVESKTDKKQ